MVINGQNELVIGRSTYRWRCKIMLGFGLGGCGKLGVLYSIKVRKELGVVVGNEYRSNRKARERSLVLLFAGTMLSNDSDVA